MWSSLRRRGIRGLPGSSTNHRRSAGGKVIGRIGNLELVSISLQDIEKNMGLPSDPTISDETRRTQFSTYILDDAQYTLTQREENHRRQQRLNNEWKAKKPGTRPNELDLPSSLLQRFQAQVKLMRLPIAPTDLVNDESSHDVVNLVQIS